MVSSYWLVRGPSPAARLRKPAVISPMKHTQKDEKAAVISPMKHTQKDEKAAVIAPTFFGA